MFFTFEVNQAPMIFLEGTISLLQTFIGWRISAWACAVGAWSSGDRGRGTTSRRTESTTPSRRRRKRRPRPWRPGWISLQYKVVTFYFIRIRSNISVAIPKLQTLNFYSMNLLFIVSKLWSNSNVMPKYWKMINPMPMYLISQNEWILLSLVYTEIYLYSTKYYFCLILIVWWCLWLLSKGIGSSVKGKGEG